jgi:membrane protease YdiL (CAAX protease family)
MVPAVLIGGAVAEAAAWWAVSKKGVSVWIAMGLVLPAIGVAALLVRTPNLSPDVSPGLSAAAGLLTGVALYFATRAFVAVVGSWRTFRRHAEALYAKQAGLPVAAAVLLAAVALAPGEELFWRGMLQPKLAEAFDARTVGALVAWVASVAANLPSRNLAIIAGAVVGGAVWTAMAWWTGGVLAPVVCHSAWTSLMVGFPVVRRPLAVPA